MIGRTEASDLAMPGQLRIPKDIAIEKHIAQFWNPPQHYGENAENEKRNREHSRRQAKENALNDLVAPVKNSLQPGDSLEPIIEEERVVGWKIIRKKKTRNKK